MSEVAHGTLDKTIKLFTGFMNKYMISKEDSILERFKGALKTMGGVSVPVKYRAREKRLLSLSSLATRDKKGRACMFRDCLYGGLNLSFV